MGNSIVPLLAANIGKVYATFGATAFDPLARTGFAGHDGWYFNFPATAAGSTANNEMVLSDPVIRQNTLIFNTVRPTSASADKCFAIPEGSLYAIDPEIGVPSAPNMGTVVVPATSSGATGPVTVLVAGQDSTQKTTTGTIRAETTNGGGGGGGGDTTQTFKFCSIGMSANSICWDLGDRTKRRQWREIPGMKTVN